MSADPRLERIDELLADRALIGLSLAEEAELARFAAETGTAQVVARAGDELELAAAAVDLALGARPAELPASLRAKLAAAAREHVPAPRSSAGVETSPRELRPAAPRPRLSALSGWLAAAAALVLAFLAWQARAPAVRAPTELRSALLARAETLRRDWAVQEAGTSASGDVAWSQELQQGVVRIAGLPANDPTREQFQLWIFDESQEHPIDGGVFDVRGGEVLIPIDAKLRVQKPTLFAVTREKPGGVVVSDQKRIVLVAKI